MKLKLLLLTLIIVNKSFGQKREIFNAKTPFRVIYARNVSSEQLSVKSLQFLEADQELEIHGEGELILLYKNGSTLELTGPKKISVANLYDPKKLEWGPKIPDIDISFLFETTINEKMSYWFRRWAVDQRMDRGIRITWPISQDENHCEDEAIELEWKNQCDIQSDESYTIKVMNIYDETLDQIKNQSTHIKLPPIKNPERGVVIFSVSKGKYSSEYIGFQPLKKFCYSEEYKKPSNHLIKALAAELNQAYFTANKHYTLAHENSSSDMKPFYQKMIDNFVARTGYKMESE